MTRGRLPVSKPGARGSPRTLSARYRGRCARCGTPIKAGDQIVEIAGYENKLAAYEREPNKASWDTPGLKPPLRWRHVDCPAAIARRNNDGCVASVVFMVLRMLVSLSLAARH
jgi:hypothetical protein